MEIVKTNGIDQEMGSKRKNRCNHQQIAGQMNMMFVRGVYVLRACVVVQTVYTDGFGSSESVKCSLNVNVCTHRCLHLLLQKLYIDTREMV